MIIFVIFVWWVVAWVCSDDEEEEDTSLDKRLLQTSESLRPHSRLAMIQAKKRNFEHNSVNHLQHYSS